MTFRFRFGLAVLAFDLIFAAHAIGAPARVAVAGDPPLANLVDLVSAELSTHTDLTVLDRADLDKLGQEQALQAVVGAHDFSPVQMIPADALILLRSTGGPDSSGVFARLVAVQPGVVLREVALPDNPDPTAQAAAIAGAFAPYWARVQAIRQDSVVALSLLGLRFDVDSPERRPLERRFNILLASRLSAEPDCVVLERWRLNDAVFEKSIQAQQTAPFWTGSSLVDGSLQEHDGTIVATVRLRPPKSAEVTMTDQDTAEHLPDLVERLADKIHQRPTTSVAWQPAVEADHFAQLGKWCLDNHLFEEGAQALESALALGDTSRATRMLQVRAYALEAYPDDLHAIYVAADNFRVAKLDPSTLPLRVAAATRAAQLARDYLKAYANYKPGAQWNPEDPVDISVKALNTTLRILCAAYENDYLETHPDDLATLRHAIQPLIADLDAKLIPTPPSLVRGAFLNYRAYYAGLWNEKPEDTLALYRKILKGGEIDGAWAREQLFQTVPQRQPFLDLPDGVPQPSAPSWMRMAPPWIVAWDGRTPEQMKQLWQTFVRQLANSPNLLDECDGMKFEVCSDQTEAARDAVGVRFVDFLQKHPEILSGPQKEEFCEGAQSLLGTLGQKATENLRPALVQFVTDLMHRHVPLTAGWIEAMTDFVYGPDADDSAPKLLAAVNDDVTWSEKQNPRDGEVMRALDQLRATIYRAKPALVPSAPPPANPLMVSQFWKLDRPPGVQSYDSRCMVDPRTFALEGHTAWVMTLLHPGKIIAFDTLTMQTLQTVEIPPDLVPRQHTSRAHHRYLEVTPNWLVLGAESMALLYSRSSGQWTKLDVPPTCYKPRWTGGQLYLLYDAERGSRIEPVFADDPVAAGSGVIGVSLPGGECQNLVSSRRVPPQNALDGQPLGEPIDIWSSATGLRLSFYDQPVYASTAGKSDWTPVKDIPLVRRGKVTSDGFLMEENYRGDHYGKLVLHGSGTAEVLLSDEGSARWNFPKDAGFDVEHAMLFSCPILRGNDLCIFTLLQASAAGGEQPYLIYFAEGEKDGQSIPLSFDYAQVNDPALNKSRPLSTSFDALHPVDNGVLIPEPTFRGFWLLPWQDIDAYRAKSTGSVTVGPVEVQK